MNAYESLLLRELNHRINNELMQIRRIWSDLLIRDAR
jgi:two-component sensor histidine kinase